MTIGRYFWIFGTEYLQNLNWWISARSEQRWALQFVEQQSFPYKEQPCSDCCEFFLLSVVFNREFWAQQYSILHTPLARYTCIVSIYVFEDKEFFVVTLQWGESRNQIQATTARGGHKIMSLYLCYTWESGAKIIDVSKYFPAITSSG